MAKKEDKPLNPEITDHEASSIPDLNELKGLFTQDNNVIAQPDGLNSDNFFRAVIQEMMSEKNISLKTEYVNVNENFAGAKLEFLAKQGNMPYLKDFINILEIKRVSLERKSRIELIKAFEKRDEEVAAQQRVNMLKQVLGV